MNYFEFVMMFGMEIKLICLLFKLFMGRIVKLLWTFEYNLNSHSTAININLIIIQYLYTISTTWINLIINLWFILSHKLFTCPNNSISINKWI